MTPSEHQPGTEQDIHVRYVFRQLSTEEEARFEDFLDANPHEADIVEGIQLFCEKRGIRTREAFERIWGEEMKGVREKFGQPSGVPFPSKQRYWLGAILILMLAGVAIWILRENKPGEQTGNIDSLGETIIANPDTLTTTTGTKTQSIDTTKTSVPTNAPFCRLSELERSKWLQNFTNEVRGYHTSAGGNDPSNSWQDDLSLDTPDLESAFQKLQRMAKTNPAGMQSRDKYALGVLYLLFKRNPSEAIFFLKAAEGISRPDYNKLRLAAYLEQGDNTKAREWAKTQHIGQSDWPKAAGPCLK